MKAILAVMCLVVVLVGCGAPAPTIPVATPTIAPIALAQTTNAPTPTPDPDITFTPTLTSTVDPIATNPPPSASPPVPTPTMALSATPVRRAPTILGEFTPLKLPGEGRGPGAIALGQNSVYVANRGSGNIAVVQDDQVREFIALDASPLALVADPESDRLYAGTSDTATLFLIQDNKIVDKVTAGGRINALVLDEGLVYVALDSEARIERYDAVTLEKKDELTLLQGFGISDLVVDTPRNRLYAAIYGKIVAIDLANFKEQITFDAPYLYSDIAVSPTDGSIWSGAYDDDSSRAYLIGYSPDGKELARLYWGSDLRAVTFDDAGHLYVLDQFKNQVHLIKTPEARLFTTIGVNELPSDAIFDAVSKRVFISNQESDNLSVINTIEWGVPATIPLANQITALAANSSRNRVYAANASANVVYVIEDGRVVGQAATGNHPADLAVDPAANRLYVANRADGTLQVIDENSLEITASEFITNFLSTVAVDGENGKLFAASAQLNPETLELETTVLAQGLTLNSQTVPTYERTNPALRKLYALASNAVPGSNSRRTLYRFLYDDMSQSKLLGSKNGGNTTALAIEPATNELFATNSHPLAYTYGLDVFDANDTLTRSVARPANTTAMVLNPATHHLFLAQAQSYNSAASANLPPDNTIDVLDTRTLGWVATLDAPREPWRMALLNDTVYVANYRDGSIMMIGDAATAQPPAPSPTFTPTPYPTWTFTPLPQATPTSAPTRTAAAASATCEFEVDAGLRDSTNADALAQLGCPIANATVSDKFAFQPLEAHAAAIVDDFRDEANKLVTVFFPDATYRVYRDVWKEGDEERQCLNVYVKPGIWRPKRGFGSVWCYQPEVQELGGGLVEERGVSVTEQTFEGGKVWSIPDVGVYVLLEDGTWR